MAETNKKLFFLQLVNSNKWDKKKSQMPLLILFYSVEGKNVRIARCELRITSFIICDNEMIARNSEEKAQNCEIKKTQLRF